MNKNYTPLDVDKLKSNKNKAVNTVLLIIATITALVLVVLLFVLIQKKSQPSVSDLPQVTPTAIPTGVVPTTKPSVATESPSIDTSIPTAATSSPESSSGSAPLITTMPTPGATQSSQIRSP